jgi:transposase
MAKPKSQPQLRLDSAHHADQAAGIPPDHWCRRFFTDIYCSFDDGQFAELYEEGGRYPISPRLLACITILQFMFRVSDREAVENTVMRRDWRWALGRDDDWAGFDASVLCNFRKRLVAHGWGRAIFDHLLGRLRELGRLPGCRRVRVDATALVADVARLSRPELIAETLRVAVCALWDGHPELHQHPTLVRLYEAYGEECWLGRDSEGPGRLSDLGGDGYLLVELFETVAQPGARVLERRELLARVLAENFVCDEHGAVRPLEEHERPGDRVVTPHEPDARVGKKGGHLWTGDKVHVVETADDGEDNFVVDVLVTDARVEDSTVAGELMERTRFVTPEAEVVVADGGYASAANSGRAHGLGLELVSPPRGGNSRGLLPVSAFTIDFTRQQATCPAGQCTERWYPQGRGIRIRFAGAVCAACPRRGECTTSANGRTLHISRDYQQLLRDRERAGRPEFRAEYRRRAGVEATISEAVHRCGLRRSRYRGAAGRSFHAMMAFAALNARRLLRAVLPTDPPSEPAAVAAVAVAGAEGCAGSLCAAPGVAARITGPHRRIGGRCAPLHSLWALLATIADR